MGNSRLTGLAVPTSLILHADTQSGRVADDGYVGELPFDVIAEPARFAAGRAPRTSSASGKYPGP